MSRRLYCFAISNFSLISISSNFQYAMILESFSRSNWFAIRKNGGCYCIVDRSVNNVQSKFNYFSLLYDNCGLIFQFRSRITKTTSRKIIISKFEDTKHKKVSVPNLSRTKRRHTLISDKLIVVYYSHANHIILQITLYVE